MLASYQAKLIGNRIEWLETPPDLTESEVIITVLSPISIKHQIAASAGNEIATKTLSRQSNIEKLRNKLNIPANLTKIVQKDDIIDVAEFTGMWEINQ